MDGSWRRIVGLGLVGWLTVVGCDDGDGPRDAAVDRDGGAAADAGTRRDGGAPMGDGGGSTDGGDVDGGRPPGRVPIFVAQGMVGRSTISCDDGRTWVADRAWDAEGDDDLCGSTAPVECGTSSCEMRWYDGSCSTHDPCDCGHSPGFSKGVVFGDGAFVATWGWGWPGSVARSTDGVTWETTLDDEQFGGIAYGAGRFVVAARDNYHSADGVTWTAGETADFSGPNEPTIWSVRRFAYADVEGGRFVAVASGNTDRDILVSSDGGETWWRPSTLPEGCGAGVGTYGGIVSGNGIIVMIGGSAACRSLDGGDTWSIVTFTDDEVIANPIWTGDEFWVWTHYNNIMFRSTDGASWTQMEMTTPRRLAAVARNPETGTLVAVNSMWSGYGEQRFLRSTDGLSWEALPDGAFAASHPIFHIEFGYAEPSEACPLR